MTKLFGRMSDNDWVTPDQFGAVGNGVTADDAAFDAMLLSIGSRGGKILLPPKRYKLNNDLTLSGKPFYIAGVRGATSSFGSCLLFANQRGLIVSGANHSIFDGFRLEGPITTVGTLVQIGNSASSTHGVTMRDVVLDGEGVNMQVRNAFNCVFENLICTNGSATDAVVLGGGDDTLFEVDGARFTRCRFAGAINSLGSNGKVRNVRFEACRFTPTNIGVRLIIQGGASIPATWTFDGCRIEGGSGYGLYCEAGDEIRFDKGYISNIGSLDGAHCTSAFTGMMGITNSTIRNCGRDGIRFIGATGARIRIVGNDIMSNGRASTADGVRLEAAVSNARVSGNYLGSTPDGVNTQRWGILNQVAAASVLVRIENNFGPGGSSGTLGGVTTSGSGIYNNF